jgi:hypothetical protein
MIDPAASEVDRALRRAMFSFCGFAAIIGIERGALDPPSKQRCG